MSDVLSALNASSFLDFVRLFNQLNIESWRIVNAHDIVPKIPFHVPLLFDYGHVDRLWQFDSSAWAKKNPLFPCAGDLPACTR